MRVGPDGHVDGAGPCAGVALLGRHDGHPPLLLLGERRAAKGEISWGMFLRPPRYGRFQWSYLLCLVSSFTAEKLSRTNSKQFVVRGQADFYLVLIHQKVLNRVFLKVGIRQG